MTITRRATLALLGSAALAGTSPARAQTYPAQPIKIVVPYPPGGFNDTLGRIIATHLQETWGQPAVVENRPGGGTLIGSDSVAKAAPDGYTLLIATQTTHAANPALYPKLPYDAAKDFAPLTLAGSTPLALMVKPSLPVSSVKELIEFAKKNPAKLVYASGGNGTSQHLTAELMKSMSSTYMLHIPYRGAGPAMTDLLGGQVDLMFDNLPSALPQIKAGKLKGLAVTSSTRSPLAPDIATVAEQGFGTFDATAWIGLLAPAGLPKDMHDKLAAETQRIMRSPDVREALSAQGFEVVGGTPEAFARFIQSETAKWPKVVKDAGVRAE